MTHHEIEVPVIVDTGTQTGIVVRELFFCHLKHKRIPSTCLDVKWIVTLLCKIMSTHALVADSSNSPGRWICKQSSVIRCYFHENLLRRRTSRNLNFVSLHY
jgi:hypothetical protein